jgi:hypothetical protein
MWLLDLIKRIARKHQILSKVNQGELRITKKVRLKN